MGKEDIAEYRRRMRNAGEEVAIIHPADSTGSPADDSKRPWKQFLETVDGEGNLPGLIYYRNAAGEIRRKWLIGASGVQAVTEASAAASLSNLGSIDYALRGNTFPTFTAPAPSSYPAQLQRRIFSVDLTSDGAGAVAATTIVPALAGYTGHAQLIGVWADSTDAATTATFAVTGGTILGPAVYTFATTANAVTQFGAPNAGVSGCPVYIRGTVASDDNKNVTVAIAGYAATAHIHVFGLMWYET